MLPPLRQLPLPPVQRFSPCACEGISSTVSGYDFWVNIPLALYDKLDITQVRAVVDAYKLASKRFSINYI